MTTLELARGQVALNFVIVGAGLGIFFIPNALLYFSVPEILRLVALLCWPLGFYVAGIGIAGMIEGAIRMARAIDHNKNP